jgi:sugar (pentulose or hexulose) kinase
LGDAYDFLSKEASTVPAGAEGLVFLPCMQGAMAPEWNGAARGVFYGLTLAHTRAHMTRAVLEGSAFGLRDILEAVGAGVHATVADAVGAFVSYQPVEHEPEPAAREAYDEAYRRYRDVYFALKPVFEAG